MHTARIQLQFTIMNEQTNERTNSHNLPYLVDENKRIRAASGFQTLNGLAGHSAYIRAAMALDFCDVGKAAHGEAVELTIQRSGNGLSDGGLA